MIELDITEEQTSKAKELAKELGTLKNSITGGQGNLAGFIGEVAVANYLGASHSNTYDYDLVTTDNKKVDVKTKRTNYPPRDHYDCSVAAFNTKQRCDYYAFVRVKNDLTKVWILGFYDKRKYFEDAKFHAKGENDPSNNFTFKADCYNMPIKNLQGTI